LWGTFFLFVLCTAWGILGILAGLLPLRKYLLCVGFTSVSFPIVLLVMDMFTLVFLKGSRIQAKQSFEYNRDCIKWLMLKV
jgi:hypothetical protein